MTWLLIEAALALAALIAIVWWTLGPVHRSERRRRNDADKQD
jgi:hypothetical protein